MRRYLVTLLLLGCAAATVPASGQDDRHAAIDTVTIAVRPGDSLMRIAGRMLSLTPYYTRRELVDEIRRGNRLASDLLQPGQKLHIPLRHRALLDQTVPKPATFAARGIYLSAKVAARANVRVLVDSLIRAGGNTVVVDLKDRRGDLSYRSDVALARRIKAGHQAPIGQPEILIDMLHQRDVHIIGRLTCFYDSRLARARPEWTPRSQKSGGPWYENGGPAWVDPSHVQVQDYLLALVAEAAALGIDEIQLDYVRFPTEGDLQDARYAAVSPEWPKHRVITHFVRRVREQLAATGVLLSADLFGVAVWGRPADEQITGQRLADLVDQLDVVSPMLYPSHFYGRFADMGRPVDYPYYVVYLGCRQMWPYTRDDRAVVRPWVQAFKYRTREFGADYIRAQLHGTADGGGTGWLLWNASGQYASGLEAIGRFMNNAAWDDSTHLRRVPPGVKPPRPVKDPLGILWGAADQR